MIFSNNKFPNKNSNNNYYYNNSNNYYGNNGGNNGYYQNYGNNYNQNNNNGYNNNGYNNNGYNYNGYYNSGQNNSGRNGKKNHTPIIITGIVAAAFFFVVGGIAISSDIAKNVGNRMMSENETTTVVEEEKKDYKKVEKTDDSSYKDNKNNSTGTSSVLITDVSAVVDDVMPSIVAITSSTKVSEYGNYDDIWSFYGEEYNEGKEYQETGAGSGIIVNQTDSELLIVTNNHVVAGADALTILFSDGKAVSGEVKATDETADIAIVSIPLKDIKESTLEEIKIARLGNSNELSVGEGVIAIGNALGYGQSVTTGVISAKDRAIHVDDKEMIVLQTDAAINGGNSGGALLNSDGEVIGINVAKYSSSSYTGAASIEGMGFAIPISSATDIMENLMSKQTRKVVDEKDRGALGIEGRTLDAQTASIYDAPTGVIVDNVIKNGAAEKAGIRKRDIIVSFDDQHISTIDALIDKLTYYKAGEEVEVKISRLEDGEYTEKTVKLKLSSRDITKK